MQKYSVTKSLGGLNVDDEVRFLPAGDYLYAENLRTAITEGGRMGTQTNVRGTFLVTQYNCPYTDVFPQGTNKTLGFCEDIKNNSIIFFNWNSKRQHGIYRFWRDRTDVNNPYGVCDQIVSFNFGWSETERITSANIVYGETGDLLYWTDSVMPRKINLTKGNVVDKLKSWDLFLPVTCDLPSIVTFTFKNKAGGVVYSVGEVLTDPTNREQCINDIAVNLNSNVDSPVTVEACDCHLKFVEKVSGELWTITVDTGAIMIVPDNWYGATLIERFFDRCKYPFLEPPLMEFKVDTSYDPNYVKNKVFQSRLQPFYDDNEGSSLTLGVWSQIPINNLGCDGTSSPQYNYIDIDFNDSSIANPQTLVLLKKINLIMREHNTGADRKIILLEPCDFLDYDYVNSTWVVHYNFYNDIISSSIDSATAAKLFDDVPLKSDAELYVKNKIVEGGILEGYNAPDCVDASVQMEFEDTQNPEIYKIIGRIRILTYGLAREIAGGGNNQGFEDFFPSDFRYPFWQPPKVNSWNGIFGDYGYPLLRGGIFHDVSRTSNDFAFFGGGSYTSSSNSSFGIRGGMEDEFDQRIPEGGFPVYAAGTQYLTISKQKNVGLATDSNGALDTSNQARVTAIGEYLYNDNDVPFDLYSEFELNVPNGVYVIRLASHWCSFGVGGVDKLGKGFAYDLNAGTDYQKTSTNVWAVIDSNGNWVNSKEITVTVNNGNVYIGEFVVADIAPPKDADISTDNSRDYWQPINAYLVDDFGSTDINNINYNGASVEKTLVYYGGYVWTGAIATPLPVTGIIEVGVMFSRACLTDHNGYWFGIGGYYVNPESPPLINEQSYNRFQITATNNTIIRRTDTTIATGTVSDYYNKALNIQNFDSSNADGSGVSWGLGLVYGFITTNSAQSRASSARIFEGLVLNQDSIPVNNVLVVFQNGRYTKTGLGGNYQMLGWYDANSENQAYYSYGGITAWRPALGRDGLLVFSVIAFCQITYPNGQTKYISIATTLYSIHKIIPDFFITENDNVLGKAHKRGGNYTYGLRLYDDAGRLCSVVKAFEMYVPFITEDIGKYGISNFSGVNYPANTFKYGKPSIKWVLASNTVFPTWATTFQWMRVKNSIYGRYLQWVANQVTYLSATATASTPEIQTSFQNADAVAIKISISNITSYYAANNDSQVGYTYQAGDRVRLIANRSLVNYQGVNDFEVTSYDSTTQSIIIKPNGFPTEIQSGTLFEIFNPKSVATEDEQIFYEVGEVVGINNGIPEKFNGIFTNGDTYWRGRLIIVNDDATKFASAYPVVIEDASISDFYVSQDQDIGRIGIIDPNFKQIYNPAKMRVSNDYQVSSANNGLSSFEELNQKELDKSFGEIKRLFFVNNNLVVVTQNKEVSNYIGIVTIQQASRGAESGILSTTEQFFGTEYYHSKLLGADFAAGVVFNNNSQLMGYNSRLANVWQYQQNGEQVISDVKMINYFKGLAGKVTDCVGIYDRNYEEYILTIWRDGVPETLAWCDAKKRWTTFYSFAPECYASLGVEVYSFNQGKLYIHDKNPIRNNFYGVQAISKLNVVFNSDPDLYKNWQACILKTLQDNFANDWEVPMIYNDNKQQSRLVKGSWTKRGEDWFASFKRNLLNPTVANPILNAEPLRSSTLVCELQNDYTGDMRLYAWDGSYIFAERTLPK